MSGDSTADRAAGNPAAHSSATGDQFEATGRKPKATFASGNIRLSGWQSGDRGWSFMASHSYRDDSGETKYSQMSLYSRDLLNLAFCLQRKAEHVMTI